MLGRVLEGRFQDVPHGGLEIAFTGVRQLPGAGQVGRAVREVCENVSMDASGVPQLKAPAARSPESSKDGSFPEAYVPPVKEQGGRCCLPGEAEVRTVKREVCGRLEAAEEACGPSFAIVEGASSEVTAAVMEEIRGVRGPFLEKSGGFCAPVVRAGCVLEVA
jgi:hypothetical protein